MKTLRVSRGGGWWPLGLGCLGHRAHGRGAAHEATRVATDAERHEASMVSVERALGDPSRRRRAPSSRPFVGCKTTSLPQTVAKLGVAPRSWRTTRVAHNIRADAPLRGRALLFRDGFTDQRITVLTNSADTTERTARGTALKGRFGALVAHTPSLLADAKDQAAIATASAIERIGRRIDARIAAQDPGSRAHALATVTVPTIAAGRALGIWPAGPALASRTRPARTRTPVALAASLPPFARTLAASCPAPLHPAHRVDGLGLVLINDLRDDHADERQHSKAAEEAPTGSGREEISRQGIELVGMH
jgi:hypothetical protein